MRTETINIYKIGEHPNKQLCFDWIRDNWHDLNQHSVDEVVASLKALHDEVGGQMDYSISAVPDRGEYIRFSFYDRDALFRLSVDDCPLTGVCWDTDVISGLRAGDTERILQSLHSDTEYQYSDEALEERCEANEYEFLEDGSVV